ncbi:MAG: PQQ-dependent sugar dehydrogenase [Rhodothermales bacterium]
MYQRVVFSNAVRLATLLCAVGLMTLMLTGCYRLLSSKGGGQTSFDQPREVDPADVALPEGYRIEAVATGLTFPTGVAFDDGGAVYVTEAGYSYGGFEGTPRLIRIEPDGTTTEIARGTNPPWNGVAYYEGAFYVAGGHVEPGEVLRITPEGAVTPIARGLPSLGDHHTNGPAIGPDGWIYFGQGTASNSAVVGLDSYQFGWLEDYPDFHDIPCRDVTLAGQNYRTRNPLTPEEDDYAMTGPFAPYGEPADSGQVVPGAIPCGGAVFRVAPEGGPLELVAWGFRNPFGLAFAPDGRLYVTDNSYDVRGSRPAFGTGDYLWAVEPGRWYGWPDFAGGVPLTEFKPPGEDAPQFVLVEPPNEPPHPAALLGVHSSSNGFDFSQSATFGYAGDAFIAQFGDMAPQVGKVLAPVGYQVVRVDVREGVVYGFAENEQGGGPASKVGGGGFERPVAARFSPDGAALYVVDFGVMTMGERGPEPRPETGVLWRITKEEQP